MFSKTIVKTDAFLDMSQTAQNLYFHLGMEADDDGFVSPKMVMRLLGSTEDDFKVLIIKKFLIPFESGVIVIRHWKQNNYIQSDRYQPTIYQDEFKIACEDNVYNLDTQYSIDKNRLEKKSGNSFKNIKPFYKKTGEAMRKDERGKWWVIPKVGGAWLEYADKLNEIEYK